MIVNLRLVLLILAVACLVMAAVRVPSGSRVDLIALGLALFVLAQLLVA